MWFLFILSILTVIVRNTYDTYFFNYTNDSLKHIKINIYGHSKYKRTRNNPASRVDVTESVSARQRWSSPDSPKDASAPF